VERGVLLYLGWWEREMLDRIVAWMWLGILSSCFSNFLL
jgi:hypothetical protein